MAGRDPTSGDIDADGRAFGKDIRKGHRSAPSFDHLGRAGTPETLCVLEYVIAEARPDARTPIHFALAAL